MSIIDYRKGVTFVESSLSLFPLCSFPLFSLYLALFQSVLGRSVRCVVLLSSHRYLSYTLTNIASRSLTAVS